MDTTPIYELRDRLRAAVMAGTSLLSEDFRLKRAYEAFKPLEAASPVFAKVGQLTAKLTEAECQNPQGALLDAITLADAVICTLGTVDMAGEVESAGVLNAEANADSLVVNAPYSTLKELLEALTTSGGGHYGYVCDTHENHPELFRDYRVKHTLVQALGASYAELADQIARWMIEDGDKTILPALYKDFDPQGKKEMVRRVQVISALAGAGANDFYVRMLKEAQKDVRAELIDALCHEPGNVTLLLEMTKTEKGKNKDKVFEQLAAIQDERVEEFYADQVKKKPEHVLKYLRNATTEWSAKLVVDVFNQVFQKLDTVDSAPENEKKELSGRLREVVRAVFGKGGVPICDCYRKMLAQKDKINKLLKETWKKPKNVYEHDIIQIGVLTPYNYWYKVDVLDIETAVGKVLHHSLIVNPDSALRALAMELYQNGNSGKTNIKFLPAAVTVKFFEGTDCTEWLKEQVIDEDPLFSKYSTERVKAVAEAANFVCWDRKRNEYKVYGSYTDVYYPDSKSVERPVKLPHAKEIINWLREYGTLWDTDNIRAQWVPLNDEGLCREMGEYFYQKSLAAPDGHCFEYMKEFGWEKCQGLGASVVRNNPSISTWSLYNWMTMMPGSKEAVMEEMRSVCHMIKNGELRVKHLNTIELENYMEKWYKE